jgi:DNA polymerase-1
MQGAGADIIKLAMLATTRRIAKEKWPVQMLLTVHDELVFEVPANRVEEAATLVRAQMGSAYELRVPLQADIGWGPNWAEAVPAGH